MDVTEADHRELRNIAINRGLAAELSEGHIVPCRGDTTLDDRLHLNQGKSRRGPGLERGESDMRSRALLVAEDRDLGVKEEGWQERPAWCLVERGKKGEKSRCGQQLCQARAAHPSFYQTMTQP